MSGILAINCECSEIQFFIIVYNFSHNTKFSLKHQPSQKHRDDYNAEFRTRFNATRLKGLMVCNMYLIEIPQMQFPSWWRATRNSYSSKLLIIPRLYGIEFSLMESDPGLPFAPSPPAPSRQSQQMTTTVRLIRIVEYAREQRQRLWIFHSSIHSYARARLS